MVYTHSLIMPELQKTFPVDAMLISLIPMAITVMTTRKEAGAIGVLKLLSFTRLKILMVFLKPDFNVHNVDVEKVVQLVSTLFKLTSATENLLTTKILKATNNFNIFSPDKIMSHIIKHTFVIISICKNWSQAKLVEGVRRARVN